MRFTSEYLDRLKSHQDLPQVATELVPGLKRNGSADTFVGPVPWREDEHPSLSVFRGRDGQWLYKDMAAGDTGDIIKLVMTLTSQDFVKAVGWLAERLGCPLPEISVTHGKSCSVTSEQQIVGLSRLYEISLPLDDGIAAVIYLSERGLLDSARLMGVRAFQPGEPKNILGKGFQLGLSTIESWTGKGHGFIVYPSVYEGQTIVHRCRLLMNAREAQKLGFKSAHWNPPNKSGLLLPDTWPPLPKQMADEIVLCEGETDCLAVRTLLPDANVYAVLGTGGLGVGTSGFKQIISSKPTIILAFQRDAASSRMAAKYIDLFRRHGIQCRALVPADGCKDWADIVKGGIQHVESLDDIAVELGDYSLSHGFDSLVKHCDDLKAGRINPIPLLWATLAKTFDGTGIPPGTIGLLSSLTGVGKSWFSYHLCLYIAGYRLSATGQPIFVLNTEMDQRVYTARLLAIVAQNPHAVTMNNFDVIEELLEKHQADINRLPLEITPPEPISLEDVVVLIQEKVRSHRFIVIDHIGDLMYGGPSWEKLPPFVTELRDIARRSKAVILLVTHLRKGEKGVENLSYSRQIENVVDFSWSLQSYEDQEAEVATPCGTITEVINRTLTVRKNRFGFSDIRIALDFNHETLEFKDLGRVKKIKKKKK